MIGRERLDSATVGVPLSPEEEGRKRNKKNFKKIKEEQRRKPERFTNLRAKWDGNG